MKGCEKMTAFYIALSSLCELVAIALLIWGFYNESKIAEWERKQYKKFRRWLAKKLISNKRFMAWLNKPAKHGKPDEDWITGQIKVFGDDMWR